MTLSADLHGQPFCVILVIVRVDICLCVGTLGNAIMLPSPASQAEGRKLEKGETLRDKGKAVALNVSTGKLF